MTGRSIESGIVVFIAKTRFGNSYDELASYLSLKTGRKVHARKLLFMERGESYAKKWLLDCMVEEALSNGWMPITENDWIGVGWTLTGHRNSFLNNKLIVFQKVAELTKKSENEIEDIYCNQRME